MRNRILPIGLTILSGAILLVIAFTITSQKSDSDRPELGISFEPEEKVSAVESKRTPKAENPGERYAHDFELTKNPTTNSIPVGALSEASRIVTDQKRSRSALLAASTSWTERGPDDVGGRTRTLMFDPNDGTNSKVWAGSVSGGLWFTDDITDAGEAWTSVNDFWANLAVTAMAFDSANTQNFYVGTGEGYFNIDAVQGAGIFKSTDGGSTFNQLVITENWDAVQAIVVPGADTVLAATRSDGVQMSTNGGTSWTGVLDSGDASSDRAADLAEASDGDIYAAMGIFDGGQIWKSTDNGENWTHLTTGGSGFPTTGVSRIKLATAPSDSNVVYAMAHDSGDNNVEGIYRSDDQGATWTSVAVPLDCDTATIVPPNDFSRAQGWYNLALAVGPTDPNELIVGGIDLFRTTNADAGGGAATWEQISIWLSPGSLGCTNSPAPKVVHADHHAIAYRPGASSEVVFGHDGGVDYTADVGGAGTPTFVNRNNGYNVTQFYAGALSPTSGANLMFGGTQDNGTPQLNAGGVSSQVLDATGGDGGFTHLNQSTNVLAMGANTGTSLHRSLAGGASGWSFLFSITGCTSSFINPSDLDEGTNELFVNCGTAIIGNAFNLVSGVAGVAGRGPVGGFFNTPTHLRASPFGATSVATVYVGTSGGRIFRGTGVEDGGTESWSEIATGALPAGSISSIDFGAGEDTLLVTFSNYGVSSVWETFDGGSNWNDRDSGSGLVDAPVRWGMYDPNNRDRVILATEVGVIETDDIAAGPAVWTAASGFPTVRTDMLKYRASDGTILAVTHGRGLWTGTVTSLPVELVAFNSIVDGNDVVLSWNTASETSNAGFEVERANARSADKSQELTFTSVGFVDGSGTTSEPKNYSFRMSDVPAGEYTYRLKQVNLDGTYSYTDMIEVSIELPGEALLSQAYPNPFASEATITIQVKTTQDVDVSLFDMQGRRVATLFSGELQGNEVRELQLKAEGLASGQYIYRATGATFTDSKTVSLIK